MDAAVVALGPTLGVTILILAGLVVTIALARARALFAAVMYFAVAAAVVAAALAVRGYGLAALACAVLGIGLGSSLLLGVVLLTSRSVKPRRAAFAWATVAAACVALMGLFWLLPAIAPQGPSIAVAAPAINPWLAALGFGSAIGCVGMLGFGERGAFDLLRRLR